ncbi:MAG: hypothetical protein Q8K75_03085 [Chlamydiales bacterium]|nr:hypothetical protein [Chlamydiales bacterium]
MKIRISLFFLVWFSHLTAQTPLDTAVEYLSRVSQPGETTLHECLVDGLRKPLTNMPNGFSYNAHMLNCNGKPCGVLKFGHEVEVKNERISYVLQQVLEDKIGLTFGVPETYLVRLPDPKNDGKLTIAEVIKYIPNAVTWNDFDQREMDRIPQREFQKLLYHVIMLSWDSHKRNILFQKVGTSPNHYYKVHLVDLTHSFPSTKSTWSWFPWQMYDKAALPLTDDWKEALANMDVNDIVDETRARMFDDEDRLGITVSPRIWDLLKLTLFSLKAGAIYKPTMREISSIFMPTKELYQGNMKYIGGEFEDLHKRYFNANTDRWDIHNAIPELEYIIQNPHNKIENPDPRKWPNVEKSHPSWRFK